jgi:hypothetical protein
MKMKARIMELIAVFILAGILLMNVRMPLANAASQTSINTAIQNGLKYLNSTQAPDGSWGSSGSITGYPVACTAMAVLAFENAPNSHFGWNLTDPYSTTVQKGLDWLFSDAAIQTLSNKTLVDGTVVNPDTSGDGIGIYWASDGQPIYETPMVLLAIVASQAPTNVTTTGPTNVIGRTYHDIATDIVDYLAWAQDIGPYGRGGWRYGPQYSSSDNSVGGWPVMGLMAAELWGIPAPAFVKSELLNWTAYDQNLVGTWDPTSIDYNYYYGAFGYTDPTVIDSIAETAAGILQLTYCGVPETDSRIVAAEGYIVRDWLTSSGWEVNFGWLYAMYGVMKACRLATPTPIEFIANYTGSPTIEWYNGTGEYADALVTNQSLDGHWDQWGSPPEDLPTDLSTAFADLILEFVPVKVTYSLTVTVEDATNNNPIVGAAVQAVGPENDSGNTGSNGQITFPTVQAGSYQVNASASGYSPSGTTVSLTSNTAVTIKLSPTTVTPTTPPKPVGGNIEPANTLAVLLAVVEDNAKYWIALLAVGAVAALIIFKRRRT